MYIYVCIKSKQGGGGSVHRLKKKCNFHGWSKGVTHFYWVSKSKALICPEFPSVKMGFLGMIKKESCWLFMSLCF